MKITTLFILSFFVLNTPLSISSEDRKERKVAGESSMLITDIVYRLIPDDTKIKIHFATHAGVYILEKKSEHFEAIRVALQNSKDKGSEVKLRADAFTLTVQEVILNTSK